MERIEVSKLGFLISGCTTACVNVFGTAPEARLQFTITNMLEPVVSVVRLMRGGGTASAGPDEIFICPRVLLKLE